MNDDTTETPGRFLGPGEVRFVRLLPGPIERVWAYLIDSEKRARWLAAGALEPRVGGRVEHRFNHASLTPVQELPPPKYREMTESDCSFVGRVIRCDPPAMLSYTWGGVDDRASEVTFELAVEGAQVRLVLTHRLLGPDRTVHTGVAAGWHTHLGILGDELAGAVHRPFWSTQIALEQDYERRLPGLA